MKEQRQKTLTPRYLQAYLFYPFGRSKKHPLVQLSVVFLIKTESSAVFAVSVSH